MSMQDPIADMFTRIRNSQMIGDVQVAMPSSNLKAAIAKVLKDEGYIENYEVSKEGAKSTLSVKLKYYRDKPVIETIKRVSKPSIRVYKSVADLPKIMGGLGIAIVSTAKGVMSDRVARASNIGGEIIGIVA